MGGGDRDKLGGFLCVELEKKTSKTSGTLERKGSVGSLGAANPDTGRPAEEPLAPAGVPGAPTADVGEGSRRRGEARWGRGARRREREPAAPGPPRPGVGERSSRRGSGTPLGLDRLGRNPGARGGRGHSPRPLPHLPGPKPPGNKNNGSSYQRTETLPNR